MTFSIPSHPRPLLRCAATRSLPCHRRPPFLFVAFLLAVLSFLLPSRLWADAPVTVTATLSPTTPRYADPELLQVTVTAAGSTPTGNIDYALDGGAAQTATLVNGSVIASLGTQAPGPHAVVFRYDGGLGTTAYQTLNFTTADLPAALLWSKQYAIYNHAGWYAAAPDSANNILITNPGEGKLYKLDTARNLSVVPTYRSHRAHRHRHRSRQQPLSQ